MNQNVDNQREQVRYPNLKCSGRRSTHYPFERRKKRPREHANKLNESVGGARAHQAQQKLQGDQAIDYVGKT